MTNANQQVRAADDTRPWIADLQAVLHRPEWFKVGQWRTGMATISSPGFTTFLLEWRLRWRATNRGGLPVRRPMRLELGRTKLVQLSGDNRSAPSANINRYAGHIARRVRQQKCNGFGNFARLSDASERNP